MLMNWPVLLSVVAVLQTACKKVITIEAFCGFGRLNHNKVPSRPIIPSNSFARQSSIKDGGFVEIRPAPDGKGLGAFATVAITKDTTLGEYTGEILKRRDVEARYWQKRKRNKRDREWRDSRRRRNQGISGDYLFDMGNEEYIDGEDSDVSSWCRFVNHASSTINIERYDEDGNSISVAGECNAKACIRLSWDEEENQVRRLFLVALRDIKPGTEICYDYGEEYW